MKIFMLFAVLPLVPALVGCVEHTPSSAAVIRSEKSADEAVASEETSEVTAAPEAERATEPAGSDDASAAVETAPAAPASAPVVAGKAPPADRMPTRPGEAEKITFDDLNLGMQADVVFRPFMLTDRVQELEGKRISIIGYMHAGQTTQRGIKDFVLLKNTQCKFGPGGQADHLATVILRNGNTTSFTPSPLKIEGTLKIEPFHGPDNNTWSIYRLEDAQIR